MIGTVRFFLLLTIFGVLYVAMGNPAGRAIGVLMLAIVVAWTWRAVHGARRSRDGV